VRATVKRGESQKRIEKTKTENIKKTKKNINIHIVRRDLTQGRDRVLEGREDQDPKVSAEDQDREASSGDQEADQSGDHEADQSR